MSENGDRQLVERLAEMSWREQRARRRWGVFFKLLFFGYVLGMTAVFFWNKPVHLPTGMHAAVVSIDGAIAAGGDNSAAKINAALRDAFSNEGAAGVILKINSPGGSPVESNRIRKELLRLRGLHPDKKLYAVAGDICASGGYYIAAAADEIYVDENSVIGSIGAIWSGFGFVGALEKLGVERRVRSAGGDKNALDPFSPSTYQGGRMIDELLETVSDNFQDAVREGRGDKLQSESEIFSGAIFSGERGIALGLADGIGDSGYVARELIGVEDALFYGAAPDFLDSLLNRLETKISAAFSSSSQLR